MKGSVKQVSGRLVLAAMTSWAVVSGGERTLASAQTGGVEVGASYAFLIDQDFNLPVGWYVDIGVSLGGAMSVIGEVGQSRTTMTLLRRPVTLTMTSYLFGARFQSRRGSIQPFVQMLGGAARAGGGTGVNGLSLNVSSTAISLQAGGGVVVRVTRHIGVTGAADYRWGASSVGSLEEVRISGGVSVGLGR